MECTNNILPREQSDIGDICCCTIFGNTVGHSISLVLKTSAVKLSISSSLLQDRCKSGSVTLATWKLSFMQSPQKCLLLSRHIHNIVRLVITLTDKDNNVLTDQASSAHKLFFLSFLSKHLGVWGIWVVIGLRGFSVAGSLTTNAPGMLHFPSATSCNQLVLVVDIF